MRHETLRKAVRLGWIPVLIAGLYVAWIFYSRFAETQRVEREAAEKAAAGDREMLDKLGGDDLKILTFYANPPAIQRGQSSSLCYGVVNANEVRLEPPGPKIYPALSRCVEVKPIKTTGYVMLAENRAGQTVKAAVTVRVE